LSGQATRRTPLGSWGRALFAVEKHVAYRTENGLLYGRPNGMPAVNVCGGLR
jgi:hypothetical protein